MSGPLLTRDHLLVDSRKPPLRRGSRGGELGEFSPPFFWAPLQSCWCTDLKHLNQALVILHYYKNSPPFQNPGSAPATNTLWTVLSLFYFFNRIVSSFILEGKGLRTTGSSTEPLWSMEKMQAYFCYIKTLKPQLTPESNRLVIGYPVVSPKSNDVSLTSYVVPLKKGNECCACRYLVLSALIRNSAIHTYTVYVVPSATDQAKAVSELT